MIMNDCITAMNVHKHSPSKHKQLSPIELERTHFPPLMQQTNHYTCIYDSVYLVTSCIALARYSTLLGLIAATEARDDPRMYTWNSVRRRSICSGVSPV